MFRCLFNSSFMQPVAPPGSSPTRVGTGGRSARIMEQQQQQVSSTQVWKAGGDISEKDFTSRIKEIGQSLRNLDISNCSNLTDVAVMAVSEHCPKLTSLDVSMCKKLTDAAVVAVSEHCPGLTSLNVCGCKNLTDAAVVAVSKKCPNLTSLNVEYCPNLTLPVALSLIHISEPTRP